MLVPIFFLALQPAAAAPPAPACAGSGRAACTVSVYFDSGEGIAIRPEWRDELDALATQVRSGARVRLDGFSDRSGPATANQRMSEARAESVRQALVQRGVAAGAIQIAAHGERDPLVPTPDGVREPQNRRVDVTVEP